LSYKCFTHVSSKEKFGSEKGLEVRDYGCEKRERESVCVCMCVKKREIGW